MHLANNIKIYTIISMFSTVVKELQAIQLENLHPLGKSWLDMYDPR